MNRHDRRKAAKLGAQGMTTFWLSFTDPEASADKRFLGVAIFDMDESQGQVSLPEIIKRVPGSRCEPRRGGLHSRGAGDP
jgi:hypothetical protein